MTAPAPTAPQVGDKAILDGRAFTVEAFDGPMTVLHSVARDIDFPRHDEAVHGPWHDKLYAQMHPPTYTPHPTGPLRITGVLTHELVWFAAAEAWTLPGRIDPGNTVSARA